MTINDWGVYIGSDDRLKGEGALIRFVDGQCLAQFDRFGLPEGHGWHEFDKRDFRLDSHIEAMRCQRRALNERRAAIYWRMRYRDTGANQYRQLYIVCAAASAEWYANARKFMRIE